MMMHRVNAVAKGYLVCPQLPLMDMTSTLCSDAIPRDKQNNLVHFGHIVHPSEQNGGYPWASPV